MNKLVAFVAVAVLILLFAGCGNDDPPAPAEPAPALFASTLEGEALARYEDMTTRQRQGVETLAERLGPERTTEWLMASEDERPSIIPMELDPNRRALGATLEGETLALYERLDAQGRADLEFYADALGHEAAAWALLALGDRERRWEERNNHISPASVPDDSKSPLPSGGPSEEMDPSPAFVFYIPGLLGAPLPPMRDALSPDEQAKLDDLDPLIKAPFVESWLYGGFRVSVPDVRLPGAWLAFVDRKAFVANGVETETERRKSVLMAIPSEFPGIADLVLPEYVAEYEALHLDLKEKFWREVGIAYGMGMTARPEFGPLTQEQVRELFSNYVIGWSEYQAMTPRYQ